MPQDVEREIGSILARLDSLQERADRSDEDVRAVMRAVTENTASLAVVSARLSTIDARLQQIATATDLNNNAQVMTTIERAMAEMERHFQRQNGVDTRPASGGADAGEDSMSAKMRGAIVALLLLAGAVGTAVAERIGWIGGGR